MGNGQSGPAEYLESSVFWLYGWKYLVWRQVASDGYVHTRLVRRLVSAVEQLPGASHLMRDPKKEILQKLADEGIRHERKYSRRLVPAGSQAASDRSTELREELSRVLAQVGQVTGSPTDPDLWVDGLLARYTGDELQPDTNDDDSGHPLHFPPESWQAVAAQRIAELVHRSTIERALGKGAVNALRRVNRELYRRESVGTKVELVEALLVQHEHDLLGNSLPLREAIGKSCGVTAPKAFHTGKAAAMEFVTAVGLPIQLAGLPSPPPQPAVRLVDAPRELPPLHDYQKEVRDRLRMVVEHAASALCSLPTGAGKTRVALEALCQEINRHCSDRTEGSQPTRPVALWVAHTEELCAQAAQALRTVWQALVPGRCLLLANTTGARKFDAELDAIAHHTWDAAVLITTAQVGEGLLSEGLLERLSVSGAAQLRVMVIDEAHRAAAPTYRRLIETSREVAGAPVALLGLTATPFRNVQGGHADEATAPLRELFGSLVVPSVLGDDPKRLLIERGCLARPHYERVAGADLTSVSLNDQSPSSSDDFVDQQLAAVAAKSPRRRRNVIERLRALMTEHPGARVLYFGPSVADAQVVAFLLRRDGVAAGVVSAKTRTSVRRETIRRFREGQLQVLCNHEVLTTGFDDPQITHVVVARPTVSLVLYEQMIGRGLRGPRFGGTPDCHIISVQDHYSEPEGRSAAWKQFLDTWAPHVAAAPSIGIDLSLGGPAVGSTAAGW